MLSLPASLLGFALKKNSTRIGRGRRRRIFAGSLTSITRTKSDNQIPGTYFSSIARYSASVRAGAGIPFGNGRCEWVWK